MSSLNQKSAGRLLYPVEGGKIPVRDLMTDEKERSYVDFGQYDYITKNALAGFNPSPVPITYEIQYTGSSLTIHWQTDLIDGFRTYAEALGDNLPRPVHYFFDGISGYTPGNVQPFINRVDGVIDTVVFDWGYGASVAIVF